MFASLLWFELKHRLLRPSSLIYAAIYFTLSLFFALAFAGAFNGVIFNFGLSNQLALNSPVILQYLTATVSYLGLLIIAPIFGQSINQDVETGFHRVLFATPIAKSTYFLVRFVASSLSSLAILLSIGLGLWAATLMPFLDRSMIAEQQLWYYAAPYLTIVLPNILLFGALFLAAIAAFKKMAAVYLASIVIFVGYMLGGQLLIDLDNHRLAALIDPFGAEAMKLTIRYWSLQEQSAQAVPLTGYFLMNRLLWLGVGFLFSFLAYVLFNPFALGKEKKQIEEATLSPKSAALNSHLLPHSWKVFWQLSLSEFKQAFSNLYFLILLACALLYIVAVSGQIGKLYGTETLPVTYQVLEIVGGTFSLFIAIITTYYGGELVWKDRDHRTHELIDATPVSNRFLYLSKLLSLGLLQLFFISLVFVSSVLIQLCKHYTHIEWSVYAQELLIYTLPTYLLISILVLFAHTLARSKMIGHSIVILNFLLIMWLPSLGFDHHLYLIGFMPKVPYSDMNGYGNALFRYSVFFLYWAAFHGLLALLTHLFWQRGAVQTWRKRCQECKLRVRSTHKRLGATALCSWMALGGFIFYNTNIVNNYYTKWQLQADKARYEKTFSHFETIPHPDLVGVKLHVDLFPERRGMAAEGIFTYRNTTSQPIHTFLLNFFSPKVEVDSLVWSQVIPKCTQELASDTASAADLQQAKPTRSPAMLKNPSLKGGDSSSPNGGRSAAPEQTDSSANPPFKGRDCASSEAFKNMADARGCKDEDAGDRQLLSALGYTTVADQKTRVRVFVLEEPLQPNEELTLQFRLHVDTKGFENSALSQKILDAVSSEQLVENGTFLQSYSFFPVIGYQPAFELADTQTRKRYGLAEKAPLAGADDAHALQKTYLSQEGTWIDFEATISTSLDQIAIAPGYLQREWEEHGRRIFHYKMDQPMLPFYSIQSGRYEVVRDQWNDVAIEVYHHPGHTCNIARMIQSVKCSLDYYTKNFSPYQFRQFRIIEFPRYERFAQAFPNTIPYSEAIGFIAKVDPNDPEDVDYPFFVTAHEMAHQWWGHQVVSGNVVGATMLSESLAQYSAFMVMEKEVGPEQMRKFLKYELDRYLHGRSSESNKEKALAFNDGQPYIHYHKGSLVFYALRDYLGEELVNQVLRDYIRDVAFQKPPFTKAVDLVERFRNAAPKPLKYLIEDLFETITFYSNRTESVQFKKTTQGKYAVEISSNNKKLRANEFGLEQEIPIEEFIDVGIYDEEGQLQYLQKHRMTSGQNTFLIEVDRPPSKAGIDPLNKLIDRIPDDHLVNASKNPNY